MENNANTKRCPYCGEVIMASAKKCRHCKEWLVKDAVPVKGPHQNTNNKKTNSNPQNENSKPQKKEEVFTASTVGTVGGILLVYWGIVIFAIAMVLHFTVPSSSRMKKAILEDVVDVSASEVSNVTDMFENDDLSILAGLFMNSNMATEEIIKAFTQNNTIEIEESFCWSVGYIHNTQHPEGVAGSFGILGIVVPLVMWDDFQLVGTGTNTMEEDAEADDEYDDIE